MVEIFSKKGGKVVRVGTCKGQSKGGYTDDARRPSPMARPVMKSEERSAYRVPPPKPDAPLSDRESARRREVFLDNRCHLTD